MNTKQVARQYRLEKWSALITERQNSGLNVREFCKERNIKELNFPTCKSGLNP